MEFLKDVLGEELYNQLAAAVKLNDTPFWAGHSTTIFSMHFH